MRRSVFLAGVAGAAALAAAGRYAFASASPTKYPVTHDDATWRRLLGEDRFEIMRRTGTEPAGSSPLNAESRAGIYACYGCNLNLFRSEWKFDAGEGWPSFTDVLPGVVLHQDDYSLMDARTEIHCRRCGSHLGHLFDDGPKAPAHNRYCIDGLALRFTPRG